MSTVNLDDMASRQRIDPGGMDRRIAEFPWQCRQAIDLVESSALPEEYGQADSIVILGLGGSAIGGDLVRGLVEYECRAPVLVNRDYRLPAFVNDRTLVVASSYSGNTEEVLSALREALEREAMCLALTTGGELADLFRREGRPLITFEYDAQPRAALGYSFTMLLALLQRLGFVGQRSGRLEEAIEGLVSLGSLIGVEVPEADNPAKQLARRLEGRLPVIYGAGHLSEVARRWKCQFNENSKGWAFWEVLPELNHNSVAGYGFPDNVARDVHVLLLTSRLYHPRHLARIEVTSEILAQNGISHESVPVMGESLVAELLWAIHLGDYVSYYLALLRGADPTPVANIAYLKERLAQIS